MLLKEQDVRNHQLDGGLVVHVDKEQDVTLVAGAQGTVIKARVKQKEALEE